MSIRTEGGGGKGTDMPIGAISFRPYIFNTNMLSSRIKYCRDRCRQIRIQGWKEVHFRCKEQQMHMN